MWTFWITEKEGTLPTLFYSAVVTLVTKEKRLTPISLMTPDSKVFSKTSET